MDELKGELVMLRDLLNSTDIEEKKEGVKRVIIAMTIGKNVTALFQPVIKCLEIPDLEIKKMIYLYIINNSRLCPDDALMIVNYLSKDSVDKRPIIRALAIRTFGGLKVAKLNEYLIEPLMEGLKDPSPYVRKTAVLAVGKMFEVSKELLISKEIPQFIEKLLKTEENHSVAAASMLMLHEMKSASSQKKLQLGFKMMERLFELMDGFSEWDQITIIDIICESDIIIDEKDQFKLKELYSGVLLPKFSHCSSALVLAAVKGMLVISKKINLPKHEVNSILVKCISPVVALLNVKSQEDINKMNSDKNFLVVKCLHLMADSFGSECLKSSEKSFYPRQNDSLSVKIQKTSLIAKLACEDNFESIANELISHFGSPQRDFAELAVKVFYELSTKFINSSNFDHLMSKISKSVKALAERENHTVIEQMVIGLQKLISKGMTTGSQTESMTLYLPASSQSSSNEMRLDKDTRFQEILKGFDSSFNYFASEEGKVHFLRLMSLFWKLLPSSVEILQEFKERFFNLTCNIQLEVIECLVRMYLSEVEEVEELLGDLFEEIDEKCTDPQVKDQTFIYWRLINKDPQLARSILGLDLSASEEKKETGNVVESAQPPAEEVDILGLDFIGGETQNNNYQIYDEVNPINNGNSSINPNSALNFGDEKDWQSTQKEDKNVQPASLQQYNINPVIELEHLGTSLNLVEFDQKIPLFLLNRFYALKIRRKQAKLFMNEMEKALVFQKNQEGEDGFNGLEMLGKVGRSIYWNRSDLSLFITIKNKSSMIHTIRGIEMDAQQMPVFGLLNYKIDPKYKDKYVNYNVQKNEISEIEIPLITDQGASLDQIKLTEDLIRDLKIQIKFETKIDTFRFAIPFLVNLLLISDEEDLMPSFIDEFIGSVQDKKIVFETDYFGDNMRKVQKKLEANRIILIKGTDYYSFRSENNTFRGFLKMMRKDETKLRFEIFGEHKLVSKRIKELLQLIFEE
jgi:AP-1 complex subunit beta-1